MLKSLQVFGDVFLIIIITALVSSVLKHAKDKKSLSGRTIGSVIATIVVIGLILYFRR